VAEILSVAEGLHEYGPPYVSKPSNELMGEMLLSLDRPGEAIAHFETALERNTGRTLSLLGLARGSGSRERSDCTGNLGETGGQLESRYGEATANGLRLVVERNLVPVLN
jgi:hypothetical protein